ncbi:class I SAM-dependent methyltransferase [Myxococcota bacterium]|nr:class I SAM-dependent methyltransferase [Myxococcota bacterium]
MERARCPLHPEAGLRAGFQATDRFWGIDEVVFHYGICPTCGAWVLDPRPTPEEIGPYYAGYYAPRELEARRALLARGPLSLALGADWIRAKDAASQLQRLGAPLRAGARVLDAGCGLGGFLRGLVALRGVTARGVDFDARCAAFAEEAHGVTVDVGELTGQGYPEDHFELITSWHCLEHVYDPRAELAEYARVLAPGGHLILETPTNGFIAQRLKGRGLFLQAPTHLYHLRPRTLRGLVEGAGLEVLKIRRPWLPSEIAGGLLMALGFSGFAPRLLFPPRPFKDRLWHALFMGLILCVDLPISALLALMGSTGVAQIIARKPRAGDPVKVMELGAVGR